MLNLSAKNKLFINILTACMLFTSLFIKPVFFNFWYQITVSIILLCFMAFGLDKYGMYNLVKEPGKKMLQAVFLGIISSFVLYGIFYGGYIIAGKIISSAPSDVTDIYKLKTGHSTWLIICFITLIIGPGEELFWRGYIQRQFIKEKGTIGIVLSSIIYSIVHAASGNIMLLAAAFICGLFWGYLFWRWNNIYLNIVSHILWDILVFILVPFQ